jgi:hypothetical protein
MSQYVAQDRLDKPFREWRLENQSQRADEAEWIVEQLETLEVEKDLLNTWSGDIDPKIGHIIEWRWRLERRLRELIRWEREDLEWEWKLERQHRLAYRRTHQGKTAGPHDEAGRLDSSPIIRAKKNRQHKKRKTKAGTGIPTER